MNEWYSMTYQYEGRYVMDLMQVVENVRISKVCSISPFKDSNEHKAITLDIAIDGVLLQAVFDKAVSSTVIGWQNGQGRKNYEKWSDKEVVKVDFKAPAVTVVDPRVAMVAKLKGMSSNEQQEYLEGLIEECER